MSECSAVRERFPDLLTGSIEPGLRERTHLHIESCGSCSVEWNQGREAWRLLGVLPDEPVPERVRADFLQFLDEQSGGRVIPFTSRRSTRWIAQAAAILLVIAASFGVGRVTGVDTAGETPEAVAARATTALFPPGDRLVVPAADVDPEILGRPEIANVRLARRADGIIEISFDTTRSMTVIGSTSDEALMRLLSRVLRNENNPTHSRSEVIEWVKNAYGAGSVADPQIIESLAYVLENDAHAGVRIKAVDALTSLPFPVAPKIREALVGALKNDPNPAVRMKAVDALARFASSEENLDTLTIDTLREKAAQSDENLYVRVKAAEALGQIDL